MGNRRPLTIVGVIFMLAALGVGLYFFAVEYPNQAALNGHEGRTASGMITHLGKEQSDRSTSYFADIVFSDEQGRLRHLQAYYPESDWGELKQGQTTSVRYLAKNPEFAIAPNSYKAKRDPHVLILICVGLFLFGTVLVMLPRVLR
jgi:hypothetical protein